MSKMDLFKFVNFQPATSDSPSQIFINAGEQRKEKDYKPAMTHIITVLTQSLLSSQQKGFPDFDVHLNFPPDINKKNLDTRFMFHLSKTLLQMFPNTLRFWYVYNPPRFFKIIWTTLKPMCDKELKKKVKIIKGQENYGVDEYSENTQTDESDNFSTDDL